MVIVFCELFVPRQVRELSYEYPFTAINRYYL